MSKNIVIPKSVIEINDLISLCDGFIIGIKDLSVNFNTYFEYSKMLEILDICKKNNKLLFISLNKNMHNSDLDNLKKMLINLSKLDIDGIIFYDIAVVNINKELNLNLKLIWHQEHLVTNYNTINYWLESGVYASYLSSEITKDEIINIRKNTNCPLFINIFGYIPMFTTIRPVVENYLKQFNLKDNSKINYLEKENNFYPIVSGNLTTIYSSKIANLVIEIDKLKELDYLVFNSFNMDLEKFKTVLKLYNDATGENKKEIFDKINSLLDYNTDTCFLYKDTVYKVKKDEK